MINHEILRMPTCWRKFIRQPSPALATSNPTAFAAWKPKVKPQPCMTADCNRTCQDGPKTWLSLLENLWTKIGISTNQRQAYHNDSTSNFQICLKSCLKSLWMYKHIHKYCICIYIYIYVYVCMCTYIRDAIPIGRPKYFTIHAILNYVKLGWSPPRGPAPSLLPPRAHARRWHRERPPLQSPAVPHGHRWTHAALPLERKSGCHLGLQGQMAGPDERTRCGKTCTLHESYHTWDIPRLIAAPLFQNVADMILFWRPAPAAPM